ncbi:MAG: DUF4397 domain-containing protein [Nocardioides sp.]
MRKELARTTVVAVGILFAGAVATAPSSQAREPAGTAFVVQAMPGASYDVAIDGEEVKADVSEGVVLGPYDLAAGDHEVTFTDTAGGAALASTVSVAAGGSTDVVLHRPAAVRGDPVVSVYAAPMKPIGPDKARVLLAHTATVPPADVQVDGQVVFTNIANGEYADADVPAGAHEVALLPSGETGDPILGPVEVDLPAGTITLVYAVGTPEDGSMNVISHQERLASDGSVPPARIETGSAGLLADVHVRSFSVH